MQTDGNFISARIDGIRLLSKLQSQLPKSQVAVDSDGSAAPALLWLDFWHVFASKYLMCANGHAPSGQPSPVHLPSGHRASPAPGCDARTGYLPTPAASPTQWLSARARPRCSHRPPRPIWLPVPSYRERERCAASLAPPREISRRREEERDA